jgi:hypothetical protein
MSGTPGVNGWVKSTYSGGEGGNCIEWSPTRSAVRDSKDPDGPMLAFTPTAWSSFVAAVQRDEFPDA